MKKLIKWFGVFAVIGTAIGLAVAYFFKDGSDHTDADDSDFTEDEDFDLDADLQPASGREYVSLKKTSEESQKKEAEETPDETPDKKSDHTDDQQN